jgi:hypothetical protein
MWVYSGMLHAIMTWVVGLQLFTLVKSYYVVNSYPCVSLVSTTSQRG